MKSNLWEQFRKLQQELMLAQTEEEAKRVNQQITMLLNLMEDEEEDQDE